MKRTKLQRHQKKKGIFHKFVHGIVKNIVVYGQLDRDARANLINSMKVNFDILVRKAVE